MGRYRVWAENAGAHRIGSVSLDHRLREASDMKQMVIELLGDLNQAINEAIAIVSGETSIHDTESYSSDSSDSSSESESTPGVSKPINDLERCVLDLNHIITCLYKFSIAIRNPAPSDKLRKCSKIDVSHFEYFDQQHVREKFPEAPEFLIERLSRANTRRRQLLKYHEKHHGKIAARYDLPSPNASVAEGIGLTPEAVTGAEDEQGEVTARSKFAEGNEAFDTSFATIAASTTITDTTVSTAYILRVPRPPNQDSAYNHEPFQCPYCYSMITVAGETSWMRHVFRDIRPYVCTFKDCPKQNHLFDSRNEWFEHEQELHRKEWYCNSCGKIFASCTDFGEHLRQVHPRLQTAVDRCEQTIQSEQPCPLCSTSYLPGRLQRHLARHMQQIALFVLRSCKDEIGDSDSNGAQADDSDNEIRESGVGGELDFDSNSSQNSSDISRGSGEKEIDLGPLESINDSERVEKGRGRNDVFPATEDESRKSSVRKRFTKRLKAIPENEDDLWEMDNLASSFYDKKQWSEAEKLYLQEFEKRKTVLGEEHPDTLITMENLATTYHQQGRSSEDEELTLQVLEKRKKVFGEEHPDTLMTMEILATTFYAQGRFSEAEELHVEVLEKRKRVLGEEHPDTLLSMNELAMTCHAQGRFSEAEKLHVKLLDERKRVLGKDHPDTLTSMQNLATALHEQGRLIEAEVLHLQVLEKRKRVLGEEHPDTLFSMNELTTTFYLQGRLSEDEELSLQILEKRKRLLGKEHPDTLQSMHSLAITVNSRGRTDESITAMTKVAALRSRILGTDHPDTRDSAATLATWIDGKKSSARFLPEDVEDDTDTNESINTALTESEDISSEKETQSPPEVHTESHTNKMQHWHSNLPAPLHKSDTVGFESRRSARLVRQDLPAQHIKKEVLEDFLKRRFPSCDELEIEGVIEDYWVITAPELLTDDDILHLQNDSLA
ncbi:TPR-like protein [Wilcoxina mikolae CBS 423.85]|nr:TPR-like protein [Wilcoxina mikolae CBS 423.85]